MDRQWKAVWIAPQKEDKVHPVMFKDFFIDYPVKKATLYITALGLFEAYINGQRISGEYLIPAKQAAQKAVPYYEYDVTDLLHAGPDSESNSFDVFLGTGWDTQEERLALKAELEVVIVKEVPAKAASVSEEKTEIETVQEMQEAPSVAFLTDAYADAKDNKVYLLAMERNSVSSAPGKPFELEDLDDLDHFLNQEIAAEKEEESTDRLTDEEMQELLEMGFFDEEARKPEEAAAETITFKETEAAAASEATEAVSEESSASETAAADDYELEIFYLDDLDDDLEEIINSANAEKEKVTIPEEVTTPEVETVPEVETTPEEVTAPEEVEEEPEAVISEDEAETEPVTEFLTDDWQVKPYQISDQELEDLFDDELIRDEDREEDLNDADFEAAEEELFAELNLTDEPEEMPETETPEEIEETFEAEPEEPETEEPAEAEAVETTEAIEPAESEDAEATEAIETAESEDAEATEAIESTEAEDDAEDNADTEAVEEEIEDLENTEETDAVIPAAATAAITSDVIPDEWEAEAELEEQPITLPEEPVEMVEVEETILIATDATWGYYGSDIEENRAIGYERFNRLLWGEDENPEKDVEVLDIDPELIASSTLPLVVKEELKPQEVLRTPDGETVLDFGTCFTGFVAYESELEAASVLHMEFAQELQEDGNFPAAADEAEGFYYISDGIADSAAPHFTCFFGRYVKVTGAGDNPDPAAFTAYVLQTDMTRTGFIQTEQEQINQFYECDILQMQQNSVLAPTHVSENGAWVTSLHDAAVFAPSAAYHMDCKAFLLQYLNALSSGTAQEICEDTDDIALLVWTLYQMYGDEQILEDSYDFIKNSVDRIDREDGERSEKHYLYDVGVLNAYKADGETEDAYIASANYFESARILSEAAKILGKGTDAMTYARLAGRIRQAFLEEYFTTAGRLAIDTQTAYVLALQFGLYYDKEKLASGLKRRLEKDGYEITCTLQAASYLCSVLASEQMAPEAYQILLSQYHPDLLPAGAFLYQVMGGILPKEPGFTSVQLKPLPDGRIGACSVRYASAAGQIVSEWEIEKDGALRFHFEIPEGMMANITLPYYPFCAADGGTYQVGEGAYDYTYMPNCTL